MADAPDLAAVPRTPATLGERFGEWLESLPAIAIGVALLGVVAAAYWLPGYDRFYNHFVWQALAFLHGTAVIDWPVGTFPTGNAWMQDVYPYSEVTGDPATRGALLPFPPLPAIVLLPFVALWGLATDIRAVSVAVGVVTAGVAWWALGRLAVSRAIRLATAVFVALGTVLWYAAQLGTTWFFAHVVAVAFAMAAVGLALGADPGADDELDEVPGPAALGRSLAGALRAPLSLVDGRQFAAGLLFGLACTARLSVAFGAPFFVLVGGGGSWARRAVSAGLGAAIPVGLLLAYNLSTTGELVHPGYEYQYRIEATGYPTLGYEPEWSLEDLRYVPQNLGVLLLSTPVVLPDETAPSVGDPSPLCAGGEARRSLFASREDLATGVACPLAMPRDIGMSILLTSPAYLLAVPALRRPRSRLVVGAALAVAAIAFVNLMHFSQGWVQFGYRFSNDFLPFAAPLVAVGMARRGRVGLAGLWLVGLSVAINLWGVIWGNILGW